MDDTTNLSLPYILAAQSQKHVTHNEALRALDALVQLAVVDKDLTAAPGSPAEGARYIVAAGSTGVWSGHAGKIAAWQDGAWAYYAPREGWVAWVADEDLAYAYNGSAWVTSSAGSVNPVALVGVNTTADTTNRLSVSSPASLFNHQGSNHQIKINKAAAANTASVLFQTAFSGRAEFGLTGDDDFHVKASADGSAWTEALVINRTTGAVRAKVGVADIASAATCNIGAAAAQRLRITGSTTITSFGTVANELRFVHFDAALTLTHNATSLILPGAANIVTAPGDAAVLASDTSGNWRCLAYQRAALIPYKTPTRQVFTSSGTWTKPAGCRFIKVTVIAGGGAGGGAVAAASNCEVGAGGAPGGATIKWIDTTSLTSETVTIGAGGTGVTGTTGNNGGTTSFGSHCSATGGTGESARIASGTTAAQAVSVVAAGVGASGDINITGQPSVGVLLRFSGTNGRSGAGASGPIFNSGGGIPRSSEGTGNAGGGYGSGGGGALSLSTSSFAGGDGAPGITIVEEYY